MVSKKQCAWVTSEGYCRWHKEPCCRNVPGACAACVRPVSERCHCEGKAYMDSLNMPAKTAQDRFALKTRNARGHDVYRTCGRKRRFVDLYAAREKVKELKLRKGWDLLVYECPFCGGYHLTHLKRRHLCALNGIDISIELSGRESA